MHMACGGFNPPKRGLQPCAGVEPADIDADTEASTAPAVEVAAADEAMEDADDAVEGSDAAAVAPDRPSPAVGTAVAAGAKESGTGKLAGTKRPLSPSHEGGEPAAEAQAAAGAAAEAEGKAAAMQDGGLQAPADSSLPAKRPRPAGGGSVAAPASAAAAAAPAGDAASDPPGWGSFSNSVIVWCDET